MIVMRVEEIAALVAGIVEGDGSREIWGAASLENAGPGDLCFAEGSRAVTRAAHSAAGCILVPEGVRVPGHTTIAVASPKLAFIRAAARLVPPAATLPGIHPSAVVSPSARLAADVSVGPQAVIEDDVEVGGGSRIGPGVVLGSGSRVGSACVLHPGVTIYPGAWLGDRVVIHAGAVIGSDGFGYVFAEGRYYKFPQIGKVVIEDDVEIGSNTTVDRGSLGTTRIGQGTKIDNLCQIAHNVSIGRHCVIAGMTGISGSTEVGDYVVMGGQVAVGDHVRIEERAVVGGASVIPTGKVIRKGTTVWGMPARPLQEMKRLHGHLSRLPELARRLKRMEDQRK
jgi:UDP-3-O-[3-hydroxymyristoyl] glucosamine N-acyltransferase